MIKRIELLTRRTHLSQAEFHERWLAVFSHSVHAATGGSLKRAAACLVLHEAAGNELSYDAISMEWFEDSETLRRSQRQPASTELVQPHASVNIIAEELVLRGADWLDQRWIDRGLKYKHMALARRAESLSASEFSDRWRNRPGRVGGAGSAPVITIPERARGLAYIQNHPLAAHTPDPRFDAINEVYFDDLDAMRERIEFFTNHDVLQADADLISETNFAIVREHVIISDR